jgi:hypothetical protein
MQLHTAGMGTHQDSVFGGVPLAVAVLMALNRQQSDACFAGRVSAEFLAPVHPGSAILFQDRPNCKDWLVEKGGFDHCQANSATVMEGTVDDHCAIRVGVEQNSMHCSTIRQTALDQMLSVDQRIEFAAFSANDTSVCYTPVAAPSNAAEQLMNIIYIADFAPWIPAQEISGAKYVSTRALFIRFYGGGATNLSGQLTATFPGTTEVGSTSAKVQCLISDDKTALALVQAVLVNCDRFGKPTPWSGC